MNEDEVHATVANTLLGRVVFGIDRSVRRYIAPIMIGSLLLNALIGWSVGDVYRRGIAYNTKSCEATKAHQQTVLDFWNETAGFRQSHSDHEAGASTTWATIANDLERDRVGDPQTLADVRKVSDLWTSLSGDDRKNADRARSYVVELEQDYDHTCDPQGIPTPHALATPAPMPSRHPAKR